MILIQTPKFKCYLHHVQLFTPLMLGAVLNVKKGKNDAKNEMGEKAPASIYVYNIIFCVQKATIVHAI